MGAEPQKRGRSFSKKVIAFAVTERSRGVRWKDIRNTIKQEFQIRPPSERQMRIWYHEYDGASIDLEKMLREALIKAARDSIPVVAVATQQIAVQQGIPVFLKALRQHRDPGVAGVVMILSTLEKMVGSEAFEKGIENYQRRRQQKITGWMNKPLAEFESTTEELAEERRHNERQH